MSLMTPILRRVVAAWIIAAAALAPAVARDADAPLPRWRGFNLLEKFIFTGKAEPYKEEDFRMIAELGFNFVRLPLDYRGYIAGKDWEAFDEASLHQIDEAIAWGGRHGIHVCINLHRAPGYTVAQPPEAKVLWTDPETQRVAARHWGMFARRYRDIPSSRLSFNLFNEPANVTAAAYEPVMLKMVVAIRKEDPDRLIFSDGLDWGKQPMAACRAPGLAMMTRGYEPFGLTHYKASWANGGRFPLPRWPDGLPTTGTLLSPSRPDKHHPLVIDGPIPDGSVLKIRVAHVTTRAVLVVDCGGKELLRKQFTTGPAGTGPWKSSTLLPEWNVYRCEYGTEEALALPAGTRSVRIRVADGDWLQVDRIAVVTTDGEKYEMSLTESWGGKPETLHFHPAAGTIPARLATTIDGTALLRKNLQPWLDFRAGGGRFMVGEWGSYNRTPHPVVLSWAEDNLRLWKETGVGWAMWNFRGPFGVLDSERTDVGYEDWHGHKLDRKLVELLRKY